MRINTGCFLNGCKCFDPDDEDGVGVRADREWHGLTNEEREEIAVIAQYDPLRMTVYEYRVAVQIAIEAKLKEKNT